jgi:addiction module RelE/StbE family toxin
LIRVRWSPEAANDLKRIGERISKDNPTAALRVVRALYKGVTALRRFPRRGRFGREPGTRELVFAPHPYIAVYRVSNDVVEIVRIRHGAQIAEIGPGNDL